MTEQLSVADVLERAADLIEPEGRWTQRALARDDAGQEVDHIEGKAACYCAAGAIMHISGANGSHLGHSAWDYASGLTPLHALPLFNDAPERTQAEVVAKLREAAALARAQGQ